MANLEDITLLNANKVTLEKNQTYVELTYRVKNSKAERLVLNDQEIDSKILSAARELHKGHNVSTYSGMMLSEIVLGYQDHLNRVYQSITKKSEFREDASNLGYGTLILAAIAGLVTFGTGPGIFEPVVDSIGYLGTLLTLGFTGSSVAMGINKIYDHYMDKHNFRQAQKFYTEIFKQVINNNLASPAE